MVSPTKNTVKCSHLSGVQHTQVMKAACPRNKLSETEDLRHSRIVKARGLRSFLFTRDLGSMNYHHTTCGPKELLGGPVLHNAWWQDEWSPRISFDKNGSKRVTRSHTIGEFAPFCLSWLPRDIQLFPLRHQHMSSKGALDLIWLFPAEAFDSPVSLAAWSILTKWLALKNLCEKMEGQQFTR